MRQASDRLYSVYCSAATREMLLCLERYPCRINYANGVLEARVQRYRHLKKLLVGGTRLAAGRVYADIHIVQKPLPLETPTVLELEPGNQIQVTLFDANHCPGAVMFRKCPTCQAWLECPLTW